jgi:hypothetical protein
VLLALDNDNRAGRAIIVGDTNYNSKPPKFNSVYEKNLEVSAPAEILSQIAKANTVEIYVGPVVYKLTKGQQQKLSIFRLHQSVTPKLRRSAHWLRFKFQTVGGLWNCDLGDDRCCWDVSARLSALPY